MLAVENIFLFLFIFSVLAVIKTTLTLLIGVFSNPPQKVVFTNTENIFLGVFLSYIITYILN